MMVGYRLLDFVSTGRGLGCRAYQEQGKGVKGKTGGVKGHAIQPALGVLERLESIRPSKGLVMRRIAVRREAVADELSFLVGEKLGRVGVVVDEEICPHGDNNGC